MAKFLFLLLAVFHLTAIALSTGIRKGCECGHGFGHPWHATLYCKAKDSEEMTAFCNGVLVSPWHLYTTRTCLKNVGEYK